MGRFSAHPAISVAIYSVPELQTHETPGAYFYFRLVALEWSRFKPKHHGGRRHAEGSFLCEK